MFPLSGSVDASAEIVYSKDVVVLQCHGNGVCSCRVLITCLKVGETLAHPCLFFINLTFAL